jgi:phosphatidylethanolamine/phosphatidyl-N-methylethanolamine N-methyltransferase
VVTVLENSLIERVYDRMSHVYDFAFGQILQSGRRQAVDEMRLERGDRVLEVGIGTGLTLPLYPSNVEIVGLDFSTAMLARARDRLSQLPNGAQVRLLRADAARLPFDDAAFDVVYAPYVITTVADPVQVGRELRRVCRPTGRVILLNHFRSDDRVLAWMERGLAPMAMRLGFTTDLALSHLLSRTGLRALSIAAVNVPPIWKLVTCAPE